MKKLTLFLSVIIIASVSFAQKEAVLIGEFSSGHSDAKAISKNVRDITIQEFTNKGMHKVIDLHALPAVHKEKYRQSGEAGMNDLNSERLALCTEMGADYIVYGTVADYAIRTIKSEDGSISYDANISVSIKAVKVINASAKGATTFTSRTTIPCNTKTAAIAKATKACGMKIKKFIGDTFKLEIQIVQILEKSGKEASKVLVEAGSDMGVKKNDVFIVNEEQKIGSKTRLIELGKLKVTKVDGKDFSQCKVSGGGDKILTAFNEQKRMKIVYKAKISLKDRLNNL
ncbi:hypothetical protein [Marinifilum sp.]|uniref:hypothetical protein n=1 Tax=Marinifilum sp. TaxID=2033137 RepID=UPI003BAAEC34